MDPKREREIYKVTIVGSAANLLLVVFKFLAGVLGHSAAMIADAVHSVSDFVTDIVVLIFVRISAKNPDSTHDYGHGKYESLACLLIGLALLAAAIGIIVSGVEKFTLWRSGGEIPMPGRIALWAALVSILVKEAVYRYTVRKGRDLDSPAVVANAWHHRSDAMSSVPVALALAVAYFAPSFAWADSAGALVVAVFILKAAWEIVQPAIEELTDAEMPGKSAEVERIALGVKGVGGCHRVRTRRYGGVFHADLHVQVPRSLSVAEGHAIGHAVRDAVRAAGIGVVDAVVHVEPE